MIVITISYLFITFQNDFNYENNNFSMIKVLGEGADGYVIKVFKLVFIDYSCEICKF